MRIFKYIKPLGFVIAVCAVNVLLSFMIEPMRGSSGTMWEEYYQEEELDTIFAGSSFCVATFDPYIFDEQLGVKSFNMGTPLQAIEQTISAVETALEDHDIKTIVIGTGFFVFQEGAYEKAELTFEKAKARKAGGIEAFTKSLNYVLSEDVRGTEKSVKYWFPWLYNQEEVSLDFIGQNVAAKFENMKTKKMSGSDEVTGVSRKGYRFFEGVVDYTTAWEINSYQYYNQTLEREQVERFQELLTLCHSAGADVIVINSPHPAYDVISCYETYAQSEAEVAALCQSLGTDYYNFSLVKPEIFDAKSEYFYDFEHLNEEGAKTFSYSLCEFLEKRAAGEDMSNYFYSVDEYLAMHTDLLDEWKVMQQSK